MARGSWIDEVTELDTDEGVADCFVCRKHRDARLLPGGAVGADDLVIVSHVSPLAPGHVGDQVYLGHLIVEPRRHAPGLADLTDLEAQRVGWWSMRAARALRAVVGAEHVYSAVLGDRIAHLHVHLLPRYPGTPRDFWGLRVDEWPDAPHGDDDAAADLVHRLQAYLAGERT